MKLISERHMNPEYCWEIEQNLIAIENFLFGDVKNRSIDEIVTEIERLQRRM